MNIHGKNYELIRASDVQRDGMALECWEVGATSGPLLEAFWRDSDRDFRFTAFEQNLPFGLVEVFVESALDALPPKSSGKTG